MHWSSSLPQSTMLIGFALYAAGLILGFPPTTSAAAGDNAAAELSPSVFLQVPGTWTVTGNLVTARARHSATLLPNGQVLAAGGGDSYASPPTTLNSAELYNPSARDVDGDRTHARPACPTNGDFVAE